MGCPWALESVIGFASRILRGMLAGVKTLVAVLSLLALPLTSLADERDDAPLDELLAGLSSKDPRTRARAAQGCGQLGPAGAACIPGLLELLDDDHGFEWGPEDGVEHPGIGSTPGSEAAYALAKIGEAAVEGLIRTARGRNAHGRVGTVFALGEIGDPRGLELMIAALRDRNAEVRAEAAASLSLEPRTLQPYIRALEDRNVDVRLEAARALVGDWAVSETVEPLAKVALRDRDVDVACTAMYSLALGGDPRGADALAAVLRQSNRDPSIRTCAARYLDAFRGNAVAFDALLAATGDPEESVALASVGSLGGLRDERATDFLLSLLASPPDDRRRRHAIYALGELGDQRAVEPLIQVLATDDSASWVERRNAVIALQKIGGTRAVDALRDALRHPDASIRYEAAKALEALAERPEAASDPVTPAP